MTGPGAQPIAVREPAGGTDMVAASVQVVDATAWDASRWDALAARSPAGEAFQSHAWGELKRTLGWTPLRYLFTLDGTPVALAALQERRIAGRLPGPAGRASILYAPRGPVLLRREAIAATTALLGLRQVARERSALSLTVDPTWEEGGPLAAELARQQFRPASREIQASRTATIVPLLRDEVAQHRLLAKSAAHNVNRARRLGVVAERVDLVDPAARAHALDAFWTIFAATGQRKGFVVRDRDYQMRQWTLLAEAGLASLWFSRHDGRIQTGTFLLHSGRRLVAHQAASADGADLDRLRPNHLLHWTIIRWAATAGFTAYDMGGVTTQTEPGLPEDPSHPLWNLFVFKKNLGARGVVWVRAHEHAPSLVGGVAWRLARRLL